MGKHITMRTVFITLLLVASAMSVNVKNSMAAQSRFMAFAKKNMAQSNNKAGFMRLMAMGVTHDMKALTDEQVGDICGELRPLCGTGDDKQDKNGVSKNAENCADFVRKAAGATQQCYAEGKLDMTDLDKFGSCMMGKAAAFKQAHVTMYAKCLEKTVHEVEGALDGLCDAMQM